MYYFIIAMRTGDVEIKTVNRESRSKAWYCFSEWLLKQKISFRENIESITIEYREPTTIEYR